MPETILLDHKFALTKNKTYVTFLCLNLGLLRQRKPMLEGVARYLFNVVFPLATRRPFLGLVLS